MKRFSTMLMMLLLFIGVSSNAQDLVISGVYDGPRTGGTPKGVELYVINNIANLSAYGLGSANNGDGSDGEEFTFPADAATAGDFIYVATEDVEFEAWFGFAPDYVDGAMSINGNDAVELFMGGNVIDIFGEIDVDGAGQPWEHLDGWAYRVSGTGPDGNVFVVANFTYSGVDVWDGEAGLTNNTSATPFPNGTYTPGASTTVSTPIISPGSGNYVDPQTVTMSCGTDGASIYYTTDGTDPDDNDDLYSSSFVVNTTTTVKARAYKTGLTESSIATVNYVFPSIINVSTIAELRAQAVGGGDFFNLTGEAFLTFQQSYRSQKYIQDATAAIFIDDDAGNITTGYNLMDGITGILGELSTFGDMLQFIPAADPGAATSTGNTINPELINIEDLNADFEDFEAELVLIEDAVFADAGGTFATGTAYVITDGSKGTYDFRTSFYDADYIGEEIPSGPQNLILLPHSRTDGEFVVSRSQTDMNGGTSNPATKLDIIEINGGSAVYENQPFTVKVQAQDVDGAPANVSSNVSVTLSIGTGSGTLGGTITGTISSGSSTVTISGVTYGPFENGVVLNAAGSPLTTGNSDAFNVLEVVVPEIVISEIMYKAIGGSEDSLEYIELYNNGSTVNLENYEFTAGVGLVFPSTTFNAGSYLLVSRNAAAIQDIFGLSSVEWTTGNLSNGGEIIELSDPTAAVVTTVEYGSGTPWPATETGKSIRFCNTNTANNDPANWDISVEFILNHAGQDIYGSPLAGCGDAPLVADFSGAPTTITAGESVDFTDLSAGDPTGWSWTFTGGTPSSSTTQNPQDIVYNTPGTYNVSLTITKGAENDTETKTAYITVEDPTLPPVADFEADVTTIFIGQSVQFTDLSTNTPTSWAWTFEGGTPANSTSQNPSVTYNTEGTFDVTLVVENSADSDQMIKTDYITVMPASVGDLIITEIMYNPPESGDDSLEYIEIYNNSDDAVSLLGYTFTDGIVYTFSNEDIASGDYILVAKSASAMMSTFGVAAYEWTSGGLSNNGELVKLVSATGATIDSVAFATSAPWPTAANGDGPSITICDPETENSVGDNWHASVNYLVDNANGDAIYGSPLMAPAPVADFVADVTAFPGSGGAVQFTNMATCNADSYAWVFEGATPATSTDANPTVNYSTAGDFDVTLTVTNSTGSHTLLMEEYIHVGVGTSDNYLENITVIPNPSNGYYKISNPQHSEMNITVYNILGEVVLQQNSMDSDISLDILNKENGIYLLQVIANGEKQILRIIKQ